MTEETLNKIDELIRDGSLQEAKKQLARIPLIKVPERLVIRFSDLLIRAGLFKNSLRLLYPFMYELKDKPQNKIIARYAISLQQVGAYREALKLFSQLPFDSLPEANFYHAIALFSQWEYQRAIPYLEKYIKFPELSGYQKLVGSLNLAVAYVAIDEVAKGKTILDELEKKASEQNYNLLLANALEIRAQILFEEKSFQEALKLLSTSDQLLKAAPSKYKVMVDFWRTVIEYALDPGKKSASQKLLHLRQEAVALGSWPLVREIDRRRSIIDHDEQLFLKVYFGTPFPAYRARLHQQFGEKVKIPDSYLWSPAGRPTEENEAIDISAGQDLKSGTQLKKGQAQHRLIRSLCSDFYIPFRAETIFSYLFDQEHYNPANSNRRVREVINRLQDWFEESKIPIEIRRKSDEYRIFVLNPYSIRVKINYESTDKFNVYGELEKLLSDGRRRSMEELCESLGMPERTLYRKVQDLIAEKKISKERQGVLVFYRWDKNQ